MKDKQDVHKLVFKPHSAKTLCGLEVIVFYPMTMNAMLAEVGKDHISVTVDKGITCEACKKKDKERG